jgi:hypothetical protein
MAMVPANAKLQMTLVTNFIGVETDGKARRLALPFALADRSLAFHLLHANASKERYDERIPTTSC